jgi:chromosome segregation ATPase
MGWVIALLAVGCVFFAGQVVIDYLRYRRAIEPRLDRADEAKQDLRRRIGEAEAELKTARAELDPARGEVEALEREYEQLHEQVKEEAAHQRPGSRLPPEG